MIGIAEKLHNSRWKQLHDNGKQCDRHLSKVNTLYLFLSKLKADRRHGQLTGLNRIQTPCPLECRSQVATSRPPLFHLGTVKFECSPRLTELS